MILLDLNLPKVDGVEVLHRIKSDARTNTIPVVVLISSRSDMDRLKNDGFSANSYIVKPVEVENFIKAVGDVGFYWAVLNKTPRSTVE
ncbi:MAG TPA: response regulator [Syntrophales bacterium]|nr:response regulator [Syntrophales bacterium]